MKLTREEDGVIRIEWEAEDLRLFVDDDGEWNNETRQVIRPRAAFNLLMAIAAANANYYASMIRYRHASDDDTDYINSVSEAMLAANALWYDGQTDQMIDWLNIWADNLWANTEKEEAEIQKIIEAFEQQIEEPMIEFIVGSIAG